MKALETIRVQHLVWMRLTGQIRSSLLRSIHGRIHRNAGDLQVTHNYMRYIVERTIILEKHGLSS